MQSFDEYICVPELSLVESITELASSTNNLNELLQAVLDKGITALNANRGFIALVDFDSGQLETRYTAGEGWNEDQIKRRLNLHAGEGKGITTYVGATGKPYRTGNVNEDPYYIPSFDDVQSELAVPMIDAYGRTRGVINVESPIRDAFTEKHAALLLALAHIASLGLSIEEHRNRERAFVEIGTELSGSMDINSLVSKVVKVAAEVLRFEDCSLFFLDKDGHTLTLAASYGRLSENIGKANYRLGEGLTGWIAEHGMPIRSTKPQEDPRWRGLYSEFPNDEMSAFLGVPIESQEGVMGVLRVVRRKSRFPWFQNDFTTDDEGVLMSIATQIGSAIQSLRLMDRVVNAERMAAWGEMSARSAHMMGNRVFAIKGDLNELEYQLSQVPGGADSCGLNQLIDGIKKGVYRLEEILMEFRDFVLATQLTAAEHNLNELVKQSIDESFPKRSNVRLEINLTSELPKVLADPMKLKRSFSELIENAVSFQQDGGMLRISTGIAATKEARDLCSLSSKRKYIRVEFADAGPGVPQSDKDKIFNPFFTSRAKGMGLGLSIVKGIIEAHHGKICEIGNQGTGARFVIFLPVAGNNAT
ncbi:MAG: GAF domain-containing protein [Armatimonadota bacterium]